jgi:hypothetical protein
MPALQGLDMMSSGQRNLMWLVFAGLIVVAVAFSARDGGLRDGSTGSYLGRDVRQAQPVPAPARDALANRAATQRY